LLPLVYSRVTFDRAELLDHTDLAYDVTAPFACPIGCSVYSPSDVVNVKPGNYSLKNTGSPGTEFTFYVVQKDAPNFDTPVYTKIEKVSMVTNQRYLTFLSDAPGFRIKNIKGDLSNDPVRVFTTGAQAMSLGCKPVFTSRSSDNAARSTLNILGPIATIDFGSSRASHSATFSMDYTTVFTDADTSSIYVSPGFVGCGGTQLYANDYIWNVVKNFKAQNSNGMCVNVHADYAIYNVNSALSITVNETNTELADTGVLNQQFEGTSFDIAVMWTKQGNQDNTQFAVQIDLLAKADCNKKA
ncbi:hypothetical protein PENTCL1PPCAC_13854, partial [Pristionchus entomophagus]